MTTLAPPMKSAAPLPDWPTPHRFSVDEYIRMKDLGVIFSGQRTELIRGLISDILSGGDRRVPHRFTVAEYDRMGELGLIPEKTELIRGEVVDKMGQGDLHDIGIETIDRFLSTNLPVSVSVRCQCSLALATSVPLPDIVVCASIKQRGGRHPIPGNTFLVVEVSDATLAGDRTNKLKLYAENGIIEYWIVNLPDDCVEVYTQPVADDQRYESKVVYTRSQSIPLAIAGLAPQAIPVDALLP